MAPQRQATLAPERGGPHDADDIGPQRLEAPGLVDFGAVRVPVPERGTIALEPAENGRMQAVHISLPEGRLSVSALAAPKSSRLWPDLAKEIDASLREGGARVRSYQGEWGRELHATSGAATSVFVGVDGARWMLYGVATGPTRDAEPLLEELRRMVRGTIVVRGRSPYPVRTVLPLEAPAGPDEADGAAPVVPTIVVRAVRPAAAEDRAAEPVPAQPPALPPNGVRPIPEPNGVRPIPEERGRAERLGGPEPAGPDAWPAVAAVHGAAPNGAPAYADRRHDRPLPPRPPGPPTPPSPWATPAPAGRRRAPEPLPPNGLRAGWPERGGGPHRAPDPVRPPVGHPADLVRPGPRHQPPGPPPLAGGRRRAPEPVLPVSGSPVSGPPFSGLLFSGPPAGGPPFTEPPSAAPYPAGPPADGAPPVLRRGRHAAPDSPTVAFRSRGAGAPESPTVVYGGREADGSVTVPLPPIRHAGRHRRRE